MKAIIAIDVQNDFVKGGALAYGYPSRDIVPEIAAYLRQRKDAGDLIIFTRDTHAVDYLDSLEGKRLPVPHCIEGTRGHDLAPDIDAVAGGSATSQAGSVPRESSRGVPSFVIDKGTFGSFVVKEVVFSAMKRGDAIDEIVLLGGCSSICLLANCVILRAAFPNKPISVMSSLCFDIDETSHKAALAVLRNQQIDIVP